MKYRFILVRRVLKKDKMHIIQWNAALEYSNDLVL